MGTKTAELPLDPRSATAQVTAILLAAGESRRMGAQKLLLPFAGTTVIQHIADQLRKTAVTTIVVVTGTDREAVEGRLRGAGVTLAHNARVQDGMLSSVRVGIRAAPVSSAAFLIALGDQPSLRPTIVNELLARYHSDPARVYIPTHENRRGHPILIPAPFAHEILTQHDDAGLRGLLRAHPADVCEVPLADDAILRDMDYPEDYRRELNRFRLS